ncbi:hypothetical protein VL20_5536 [Microcystis panniformis FACHB-1757]|uniref:Uncharacterized protein n=1 Tax=Microcystis panniformis FACHB-1757 TaxID=1638788 RepID=A0A0K1S8I6_9CHRO|nr:hypothetical protein VL20_5536 [Microcystis panniformis FACHB-1757]
MDFRFDPPCLIRGDPPLIPLDKGGADPPLIPLDKGGADPPLIPP